MPNVNIPHWLRVKLHQAFEATKTVDEMLELFQQMESCIEESDLGVECWKIAEEIMSEIRGQGQRESLEKVILFGKRALRIFTDNEKKNVPISVRCALRILVGVENSSHGWSDFIASVCYLLGCAYLELENYDTSLGYLSKGNKVLIKLQEENGPCMGNCVSNTMKVIQSELFMVKFRMGKREDAVVHLRKVLEIQEKTLEEGCIELGESNSAVSDAYIAVMNFKEALPFCLNALEIYEKHMGSDCLEVARLRKNLGVIYNELKEYEKALEQNRLSQGTFKSITQGGGSSLVHAEVESSCMLIGLGRYEEAIEVLKPLVSGAEIKGGERLLACISMARAFYCQGKLVDSKKYMGMAHQILEEEKEMETIFVAVGWGDLAILHQDMKEYETAISLLRKALSLPGLPQEFLAQKSARLFTLITVSGNEKEGVSYLEEVLERLKESFDAKHIEIGYGYQYLGVANMKLGRSLEAAKHFENAKDIFDASLGPGHLNSLTISHTLSLAYAKARSYDQALACQQKVVEGFELLGPSEQDKLDEAIELLNHIKKYMAPGSWMMKLLWCPIL